MAVLVRNLVPYEVTFKAHDLASGKPISNARYVRSGDAGGGYGALISGSDVTTFLTAMLGQWTTTPNPMVDNLSTKYEMVSVVAQAIVGHGYPTPVLACGATLSAGSFSLSTPTPHGLTVGQYVLVSGFSSPTTLNQSWRIDNVVDPFTIVILGTITGPVAGTGFLQRAYGRHRFNYVDRVEILDSTTGVVTGDALPLFADFSMRRLNTGTGRNWKSRLSVAIVAEDDQSNGRIANARITALNLTGATMGTSAWTTGGSQDMRDYAVSKQIAFSQPNPYTEADTWTRPVTGYVVRDNLGSFVKRKPKLTSIITP